MGSEPEHRFERHVPIKAAVVAKDEFIEIGVDMLAPQAVIRAQRPAPSASATRRRGGSRRGRLFKATERLPPQAGQTNPSGQDLSLAVTMAWAMTGVLIPLTQVPLDVVSEAERA